MPFLCLPSTFLLFLKKSKRSAVENNEEQPVKHNSNNSGNWSRWLEPGMQRYRLGLWRWCGDLTELWWVHRLELCPQCRLWQRSHSHLSTKLSRSDIRAFDVEEKQALLCTWKFASILPSALEPMWLEEEKGVFNNSEVSPLEAQAWEGEIEV